MKTKDELIAEIVELADGNCYGELDASSFERDLDFLLADYDIVKKPTYWVICPDCFGDGVETCHNPDHGFLVGVLSGLCGANESACPCCGHSSDHKMKGKCETCKGKGQVSKEEYDKYVDEFVDEDDRDVVDEHCLKNWSED